MLQRQRNAVLRRERNGLTIIETIIAIVVLSLAIPPVLWTIQESHHHRSNVVLALRARWLAEEAIEDVIADRYSTTRGYGYLQEANYPSEDSVPGFPGFRRRVLIVSTGPDLSTPGDGYKVVTVNVSWTGAEGVERTLSLGTVVTEYET